MKKTALFIIVVFAVVCGALSTQANNQNKDLFNGLIISWEQPGEEAGAELFVRTREVKNSAWTRWYKIEADGDIHEHDENEATPHDELKTLFSTNLSDRFEYKVNGKGIKNIHIEKIFSDGQSAPVLVAGLSLPKKSNIVSRSEWGANEQLTFQKPNADDKKSDDDDDSKQEIEEKDPDIKKIITHDEKGREYVWPLQYAKKIKFIVVHHTATVADLDDPKTAIQNIHYFHAIKRGWGDIGYHYIIAPNGKIFEGRQGGDKVIGGHSLPVNKVSVGISILGNYEKNEISPEALKSLMALVTQLSEKYKLKIDGTSTYKDKTYPVVHGHYQNTATACPGFYVKSDLTGIKILTAYERAREGAEATADYDFSDKSKRQIITAAPDTSQKFSFKLKNTGTRSWNNKTFLEQTDYDKKNGLPKIIARLTKGPVKPGNYGTFEGEVPRLYISGLRSPEVALVANGSVRVQKPLPLPIFIKEVQTTFDIVDKKNPTVLKPAEKFKASITLKNTGNITWRKTGAHITTLRTKPLARDSRFFKTNAPGRLREKSVKPGDVGHFDLTFTAPPSGGIYHEQFMLHTEGVKPYEDKEILFTVNVDAPDKPLRVKLSFKEKDVTLRSDVGISLNSGKKTVARFEEKEQVRVTFNAQGKVTIKGKTQSFTLDAPVRFKPRKKGVIELVNYEKRPAWNLQLNDNLFRGTIEVAKVDGAFTVINELPLEDYLKGLAEVSNGDPPEKIKTIIILARSYARYYRDIGRKFPGKPYDLDDDPDHTQKYVGYGLELRSPNLLAAVQETRGMIVTFNGKQIITPYFTQSDGRTRSAQEVWGWKDAPYLVSVDDSHCGATQRLGHGVGLSGCGATALAKQGKTAEEIIKYYYKGVEIQR